MGTPRYNISDLAAAVGAAPAEALPPTELESFTVNSDGRLTVRTAGGGHFTIARREDVPPNERHGRFCAEDLIGRLVPGLLRYGGRVPRGVPFYRRSRFVGGQRVVEFLEAGR